MGRYLLKPKKDSDFYVDWSTFDDDAVAWGDRDFMISLGVEASRLDRCDDHGTSAFWFRRTWLGEDSKDGEVWKQQGWLPYNQMEGFFERISDLYPDDEKIPENLLELHPELRDYLNPLED